MPFPLTVYCSVAYFAFFSDYLDIVLCGPDKRGCTYVYSVTNFMKLFKLFIVWLFISRSLFGLSGVCAPDKRGCTVCTDVFLVTNLYYQQL